MSGQDVYKKVYEDAERKVTEAAEAIGEIGEGLREVSDGLTRKAEAQRTPQLRVPSEMEIRQMSLGSVYEEILDDLTDDVKVTVVYDSAASDGTRRFTTRRGDMLWSEKVLLMTRVEGDMTKVVAVEEKEWDQWHESYDMKTVQKVLPAGTNKEMPKAYTTIVPVAAIRSIDVAWEVDMESLREQSLPDGELPSFEDCPPFPALGGDKACASGDEPFSDCGTASQPSGIGAEFKNTFGLWSASKRQSQAVYKDLPPIEEGYRHQLEPFANKTRVIVRGKMSAIREYPNYYRIVLVDAIVKEVKSKKLRSKISDDPMDHIVLFVSKDFPEYHLGTMLDVYGPVYAYTTDRLAGHRQLGVCARKVWLAPKP